jgi:hypothetical protein
LKEAGAADWWAKGVGQSATPPMCADRLNEPGCEEGLAKVWEGMEARN